MSQKKSFILTPCQRNDDIRAPGRHMLKGSSCSDRERALHSSVNNKEVGENNWLKGSSSNFSTRDANKLKRVIKLNIGTFTNLILKLAWLKMQSISERRPCTNMQRKLDIPKEQ